MIYLPDTNALSRYFGGRDPGLNVRMKTAFGHMQLSVIVAAELDYGARKKPESHRYRDAVDAIFDLMPIADFTIEDAQYAAQIRAHLESAKPNAHPIGAHDVLIAAQAVRLGAVVITHNIREFSRVPGLTVEDWQSA